MRRLCGGIAITLYAAAAAQCQTGGGSGLCFAFLNTGNVFLSCGGETVQVTDRGEIESFAISDKRPMLAYTTSRKTNRDPVVTTTSSALDLIDLSSRKMSRIEGPDAVMSTCGGIFSATDSGRRRSGVHDFVHSIDLNVTPYVWFRCSEDGSKTIGTTQPNGGDLYEGMPPRSKIANAERFGVRMFDISPDGAKVVFTRGNAPLCVAVLSGQAICTEESGSWADTPSVRNSGEVLVTISTEAECFYRSQFDFSFERKGGGKTERRDACLGIGYWMPGSKSTRLVEAVGRNPQWIDVNTATLLRKLVAHTPK